jgi:hypothetical protein
MLLQYVKNRRQYDSLHSQGAALKFTVFSNAEVPRHINPHVETCCVKFLPPIPC